MQSGEVSGWGHSGKGSVGSVVVVEMLEAVEEGVERLDVGGQIVDAVELLSPDAVAAFDGAVELGGLWGQFVEGQSLGLAGLFELGLEL